MTQTATNIPNGPFVELRTPAGLQRIPMGAEPVTIGRHSTNKVVLISDDMASRFHCVIERAEQGAFRVRDLDSRNGIKINGQQVKVALLLPGDVLSVGKSIMRVVIPGAAAPTAAQRQAAETSRKIQPGREPLPAAGGRARTAPATGRGGNDDERIAVDSDGDGFTPGGGGGSPEEVLRDLAESLPDRPFDTDDIALHNARGGVAHGSREDTSRKDTGGSEALNVLRLLLLVSFRIRASDIHIEPKNDNYSMRIRVDGNMVDVVKLTKEAGLKLTSLVKILCDIDISQRNIIQEGHFSARVPGRRVDYRVSFAPAMFGQKLVIRILDTANTPLHVSDMKLPPAMNEILMNAMQQEAGMILVCGPTGSGKTTTLYAVLRDIDVDQRNVVTIEDPVEIQLEGVTQIPVNEEQGNSFSALLRSVLRQDPDAILVGEIRDPETARIAMQAAITGHLVFSTVHSRDTVGTVFRLLDLGVEPYLVAQGLHLVLAQRLVRQLCPYCKKPVAATTEQQKKMTAAGIGTVKQIYTPGGCQRCLGTGFAGRRAIFELLGNNESLRDVILKNPTIGDIQKAAGPDFVKISTTGYGLVAEGACPFDEIDRAVS
ncbi:MAG: ATPase, T2SS/T4P/T4SS family [Tepidisphaeraceae bacterium]